MFRPEEATEQAVHVLSQYLDNLQRSACLPEQTEHAKQTDNQSKQSDTADIFIRTETKGPLIFPRLSVLFPPESSSVTQKPYQQ